MKRGDAVIIAAVLALTIAAFPLAASARDANGGVRVTSPDGMTSLSADEVATLEVAGAQGVLTVEVAQGRARVRKAGCPDQVCVRSGWSDSGRPIVCAPNGVIVESGGAGGGLDAVSR